MNLLLLSSSPHAVPALWAEAALVAISVAAYMWVTSGAAEARRWNWLAFWMPAVLALCAAALVLAGGLPIQVVILFAMMGIGCGPILAFFLLAFELAASGPDDPYARNR
jgi:uncharacterized protein (DUF983 family)